MRSNKNTNINSNPRKNAPAKKKALGRKAELNQLASARTLPLTRRCNPYPARQNVRCTLNPTIELFTGVNSWAISEFAMNSVRQPFGTGGNAVGYDFYSQIYRIFRVNHCEVGFVVTNLESVTPLNIYLLFGDTQPSTLITSWAAAELYASSTFSTKPLLIPGNSANPRTVQPIVKIPCGDILGNDLAFRAAAGYTGTDTTVPTQTIWCAFVSYSTDPATTYADGLHLHASIVWSTEFYSLRAIA